MPNKEFTYYKLSTNVNDIATSFLDKFNTYKLNFPETQSDIQFKINNNLYEISFRLHKRDKEYDNFGFLLNDKNFDLMEID